MLGYITPVTSTHAECLRFIESTVDALRNDGKEIVEVGDTYQTVEAGCLVIMLRE